MTKLRGVTWNGPSIDDREILAGFPADLREWLGETNGFILHHGALHVRGACLAPVWHSLRSALRGPQAFHVLYDEVESTDIPFAQDQLGDQFLLRNGTILRLKAETGEIESLSASLDDFFSSVSGNLVEFLNVGLDHVIEPGQLLLAYPPFCLQAPKSSLKAISALEVISLHADFARQIQDVPDGEKIIIRWGD